MAYLNKYLRKIDHRFWPIVQYYGHLCPVKYCLLCIGLFICLGSAYRFRGGRRGPCAQSKITRSNSYLSIQCGFIGYLFMSFTGFGVKGEGVCRRLR